ncbi:MAG: radical SAM family heme chaperone HemW [Pseudomonadota bacterium]
MHSPSWSQPLAAKPWTDGGFGLYIHWPFCEAKCPYCDFNSHVVRKIDQNRWAEAYLQELDRTAANTSDRLLNSVFFGGGTPSLMDPQTIDEILTRVRQNWSVTNDIEITMEANPSSVEANRFAAYRSAGINRVSLGVQALNDPDLKALGRLHSAKEARIALDIAQNTFERVSFDLIYARQGQSVKDWETELTEALTYGTDHMSLYQLTIEDGTAFGDRFAVGKLRDLPSDDSAADMFELTQDMMRTADMPAYEVSNHAKMGQESQHNMIYWRGGDYIGIGPGAHGRLTFDGTRFATETPLNPSEWLIQVEDTGNGAQPNLPVPDDDVDTEYLMMALRTTEGADLTRLRNRPDDDLMYNINDLVDSDLLVRTEGRVSVPPSQRILLNAILRQLLV